MKNISLAGLVLSLAVSGAFAADNQALQDEGRANAMKLGKSLKTTLQGAMKSGGPVAAVKVCNSTASPIAEKVTAETGWAVGRTSLKLRNPDNAPDEWELAVLNKFEERKVAGESPKTLEYGETVMVDGKETFRFMKAIPTGKVCMNCHGGDQVKAEVAELIEQLYPDDKARGYKPGDLRGAFTLSKTL